MKTAGAFFEKNAHEKRQQRNNILCSECAHDTLMEINHRLILSGIPEILVEISMLNVFVVVVMCGQRSRYSA